MSQLRTLQPAMRSAPFNLEAEQAVLGGLLLDNRRIPDVCERLRAEDFYRSDHRVIFTAILEVAADNRPCDFVTLTEHLRARRQLEDAGGLAYLGTLANDTPSAANVGAYAAVVSERAFLRALITIGGDLGELGHRPEGRTRQELVSEAQRLLINLEAAAPDDSEPVLMRDMIKPWHDELEERRNNDKPPGLQTGFKALDEVLVGLEPGDLVIAAGDTGVGKTIFGLSLLEHAAEHFGTVLGFSLEMPGRQWLTRYVSKRAEVPVRMLRDPRSMDTAADDAVVFALQKLQSLPIYVDDRAGLTIHQLRSKALRLHRKRPLKFILIDYIQLVRGDRRDGDNRTNEMDSVSRGLKALAKELGCPIVALAQLSRALRTRDNKRPRLGDLRESGGIEQDADIIIGLYRDEYYNSSSPHKGIVEVGVLKQRNGGLDTVELAYHGPFCRFTDYHGPDATERKNAEAPTTSPRARSKGISAHVNGVVQ